MDEPLYVGDILSYYGGNEGYYEVIEKPDGFWLTDCSGKVYNDITPKEELNEDEKLDGDLDIHYTKVDKNNPLKDPPIKIYCDQCGETLVGTYDVETEDFTWLDTCGKHDVKDNGNEEYDVKAICKLCLADPTRKPPKDEVMEYFKKRYSKCEVKVVPGHWPHFKTKEEVDRWIDFQNSLTKGFDAYFSESFNDTDKKE